MQQLTYAEAIARATVRAMERDPNVVVAGIGVDDAKGIFGTTRAAFERFGKDRVVDIPNMENAFAGIAIGAAAVGLRPLVVHPRVDFTFLAMDMLVNLAAKWRYMYQNGTRVPVVVRAIVGRGWGQGATHSQSLHATYGHFPGLVVATPATPADAAVMLISALEGEDPTILIEHRSLYDRTGPVPTEPGAAPFGRGRVVRDGTDVTIVGASLMAYEALRAADILAEQHGVSAEVIDPRSVRPLDEEIILASIGRTGHLVVADTSWATYGFAAEVAAIAAERGFRDLRAPVRRVALPDCPAPVSKPLEDAYHPTPASIAQACLDVLGCSRAIVGGVSGAGAPFMGPY